MAGLFLRRYALCILLTVLGARGASGQVLGTFSWQLQPYCNTFTLTVTKQGAQYHLDGKESDCSGSNASSTVRGLAFPLASDTLRMGLSVVSAETATPIAIDAVININSLSGTWRDSSGLSGSFVFEGTDTGASRPPAGLLPGSVTGGVIASGSISQLNLADGAVTGSKLADGAVTAAKVADGAVTAPKIGEGAITSLAITAGAVTGAKLADSAVSTAKLADGAVTASKTTGLQRTISACASGFVLETVAADGSVICGPSTTVVVDSSAVPRVVGIWDNMYAYAIVFKLSGRLVRFRVRRAGFYNLDRTSAYYSSADCTGTPYIFQETDSLFYVPVGILMDGAFWAANPEDTPITTTGFIRSVRPFSETGASAGPCAAYAPYGMQTSSWFPLANVGSITALGYVPPFRLQYPGIP